MNQVIMDAITTKVKLALLYADRARSLVGGDMGDNRLRHEAGAVAIAQIGYSEIKCAYTLYIANSEEEGENQELEDIFNQYDTFMLEIATNLATNHSHQWSDIECETLFRKAKGTMFDPKLS